MTTIFQGSQGLGVSRLSLPFLVGTFFTSNCLWRAARRFVPVGGGYLIKAGSVAIVAQE